MVGWIVDNRKGRAMGSRGNKTLIEQAADAVEAAVGTAVEKAGPVMADAKDKAVPVLAEARDKAAPVLAEARDKAAPMLADAKEKAMPILAQGAAIAADRAASAADYAAAAAADARDAANAKAAELQSAAEPKKHRLRTFLLISGIAAALAFLVKRLTSRSDADDWQSSYTPPTSTGATAGTPFDEPPTAATTDEAGASPDEALADAVAQGHAATTPDDPAEVVEVEAESSEQSGRKP